MTIVTLGVDLGRNLSSIVGMDAEGRVVLRRRVRRATLAELPGRIEPCTVAMEACCGAHHVGRLFAARGHEVRLMSPECVRPYVRAQKNDDNDAEGIAEAATRPTMRFVELKSQERLDLQTLHRVRSRLVAARKALLNQLRAILLERGYVFQRGRKVLERELDALLTEPPSDLSARILTLVAEMRTEWRSLDRRIEALNDELAEHARADEAASRLTSIPGIGVLGATALVAAVGDGEAFRRARDLPGMARPLAAADDDRRQAEAARDHQAGEHLPAHAADPRGARRAAGPLDAGDAARAVVAGSARQGAP